MPKLKVVSAAVEPALHARIVALKKRDGISTSRLLNEMIEMVIDKREAWKAPRVELPKPPKV